MAMIVWFAVVALGSYVGGTKNRPVLGAVLTLFLGLIGLLVIALVPRRDIRYRADWSRGR